MQKIQKKPQTVKRFNFSKNKNTLISINYFLFHMKQNLSTPPKKRLKKPGLFLFNIKNH